MEEKNGQLHMTAAEYQKMLAEGNDLNKLFDKSNEPDHYKSIYNKSKEVNKKVNNNELLERKPSLEDKIKFTINVAPVTKKNHQRIFLNKKTGKRFIAPSVQYEEYFKSVLFFLPKDVYVDYEVNIKCLFYMKTKRKCDLTNLLEAIDDAMVDGGIIKDDNFTIIAGHDGSRVLYDKENPRTEIEIERIK